jgi:F-type H+-transporting ATPase subunit b
VLVASSNFLVPNLTFVVEWVIFLLVIGIIAKYILPYINKALESRQQSIARSLEEAEEARARARQLEDEQRQALEAARQEARTLKDEATKVGEQLRQELQKKGEDEYQRLVARAGADIEASARKAAEALRGQVADLVIAVTERVLGEGISLADQQHLVGQAIAEVEAASGPGAAQGQGALAGSAGARGAGL